MSKTSRIQLIVLICGLSTLSSDRVLAAGSHKSPSHVRFDNDRISEVFQYALKRSPSFGDLIATLELLDRTVYVKERRCRHREQRACLQLLRTSEAKNLLIKIDPRQPIGSVVRSLAHELHHAVKIACERDARDTRSVPFPPRE